MQEQVGRVTNALGWVAATPPSWFPPVATDDQIERYLKPTIRGEREGCYAITEASGGSDVDAIEATACRDGDEWVLNGVKWHVTSYNSADYCFFQAKKINVPQPERTRGSSPRQDTAPGTGPHPGTGESPAEHLLFLVDLPGPGVTVVRTPAYSHTISHHHPIVEFTDVRVPAANLVGAEGGGLLYSREWFRFERLMVAARCTGAAGRLVAEMTAFASTRVAGGVPIAAHGLVAGMLADSVTELFAARSMLSAPPPSPRPPPRPGRLRQRPPSPRGPCALCPLVFPVPWSCRILVRWTRQLNPSGGQSGYPRTAAGAPVARG